MWARQKQNSGFTVVELTIFIAISGLLLVVALAGVGATTSSTRFNDGVRSLETFLQSEYADTINGVNPRSSTDDCFGGTGSQPGASTCLLLGRVIEFDTGADSVKSYVVTGTVPASPPPAGTTDANIIRYYTPRKTMVNVEDFLIPWGTLVSAMRQSAGGNANSIAFIRSPESGQVIAYIFFNVTSAGDNDLPLPIMAGGINSLNQNTSYRQAYICLQSPFITGQRAVIAIAGGQGQDLIKSATDVSNASNLTGVPNISC